MSVFEEKTSWRDVMRSLIKSKKKVFDRTEILLLLGEKGLKTALRKKLLKAQHVHSYNFIYLKNFDVIKGLKDD